MLRNVCVFNTARSSFQPKELVVEVEKEVVSTVVADKVETSNEKNN